MKLLILPVAFAAGAALVVCAPGSASVMRPGMREAAPVPRQGADGRTLYLKSCRQCHGATGAPSSETKAKYPKIKSLNDAAFLATRSDDSILVVMKKGAGKDMKAFGDRLNKEEMLAVLTYVRTLPSKKK